MFRCSILAGLAIASMVASAAAADRSCRHTAGAREAARLAGECRQVAESSRWPCSTSNSCTTIIASIRKGCADLNYGQGVIEPKLCRAYLRRSR